MIPQYGFVKLRVIKRVENMLIAFSGLHADRGMQSLAVKKKTDYFTVTLHF